MKKLIHLPVLAYLFMFSGSAFADWEPTFVDNFDGNQLNPESWGTGRQILSRRIHYYDADALQVSDGKLQLNVLNQPESDRPYTTPAVTTQGTFAQQYGYFEIRAKIPHGNGYWPAFWLMPETGVWTSEIDIAEFRGHLPDSVHYAFHYGRQLRNENGLTQTLSADLSQSYNNFAVQWSPSRIDYLFNGQVMHSVTDPVAVSNATSQMYLIVNMALSSQHSTWIPVVDKDTDLTQSFSVEYVRVYEEVESGTYTSIPAADAVVPDLQPAAYDNTALSVDRTDANSDIMRTPGTISGSIQVSANKANYAGSVTVFLTQLSNFNTLDGRYDTLPALESRKTILSLDDIGETQVIDYSFDTFISTPGVYSIDVTVKDSVNFNKKALGGHRIIQYVDSLQPATTIFFQGFFRDGNANYAAASVDGTLQLQLQQSLLTPYLDVSYQLVDTYTSEVLATASDVIEHDYVGLLTLSPSIAATLDTSRSVGLIVDVAESSGSYIIPRFGVHVAGTAPPPIDWNPGGGNPPEPPIDGGAIPLQNWESTFVDNFDGDQLNGSNWITDRGQLPRRINYYDRDALDVSDGFLNIKVLNRPESDRAYTTGTVSTQGLFKQQYGYFEMRAKVPHGNGFWPAFWLYPESGVWTSEIDIAEFRGQFPDSVHHAFHYGKRLRNENGATVQLAADLSQSFNNYAVYWTPERIDYLFNDTIVHSVTSAEAVANANSELYLILNMALSSQHASNWIPTVDADTDLSQAFSVDYVRVYRADPAGSYSGIPAADDIVPDTLGPAYDNTALDVDRVLLVGEADIMRTPGTISGRLELTSRRSDYAGTVSAILVKLDDFNSSDGRYSISPSIESKKFIVDFAQPGDTQYVDYAFSTVISEPGVYAVDVLVKDPATGNKRTLSAHRVIQYVDTAQPDTTAFFQGFLRDAAANYVDGSVDVTVLLQIQQALLAPYLDVSYELSDASTGAIVTTTVAQHEHSNAGIQLFEHPITAALDVNQDYNLSINISDSSGQHFVQSLEIPIGGIGTVPVSTPPTLPPVDPEPVIPDVPLEQNTLHGVTAVSDTAGLEIGLDMTLPDIVLLDELIYNVKFFSSADNTLAGKFTGNIGSGYPADRNTIAILRTDGAAVVPGDYRVVVFIYRNDWTEQNRLLFDNALVTVPDGS